MEAAGKFEGGMAKLQLQDLISSQIVRKNRRLAIVVMKTSNIGREVDWGAMLVADQELYL